MHNAEKKMIITLTLLTFVMGTSEFIVVGLLSDIAQDLQISMAKAGQLVSVFAMAYAIGTPVLTAWCSRFAKYPLGLVLMVVFIIGNAVCAMADSVSVLLWARVLIAVVSGVLISLAMVVANEVIAPSKRASVVALIFAGFAAANVIGVPLGTWIGQLGNWRFAFGFNIVLGVLVLILQSLNLPKQIAGKKVSLLAQMQLFKNINIILTILIPMLGAAATFTVYTYITTIITQSMGIDASYTSLILLLFGIFAIVSNVVSAYLARNQGLRKLPWLFIAQAVIYVVLFLTMQSAVLGLLTLLAMALLFYAMNTTVQLHFMGFGQEVGMHLQDFLATLTPVAINLGICGGAFLGGVGIEQTSLQSLPLIAVVLALMAAGLAANIGRKTR